MNLRKPLNTIVISAVCIICLKLTNCGNGDSIPPNAGI